MASTAGPSRTMRPRRSSALTSKGRMVSSTPVCAGARTGMARLGLFIANNIGGEAEIVSPLVARLVFLDFALEHDLFRKPASTFRDHALPRVRQAPGQNPFLGMQPVL